MDNVVEANYPLTFREEDAKMLGDLLQHQHSVELVGMRRVGISNFLRFFLFHQKVKGKYMSSEKKHLFILVDLNDLIEREIFPFWRLSFKRIVDAVEESTMTEEVKKKISSLFVSSIQSGDLFLTYDGVREALSVLTKAGMSPVLFLSRFDRLKNAVTPQFFDNLQGLKDATHQKLSYVFTSFRELDALSPDVFIDKKIIMFTKDMYIKPAKKTDCKSIFASFATRYELSLSDSLAQKIISLSGGHVQYLQFALLILNELGQNMEKMSEEELLKIISHDERIAMQSEELWESLTHQEQDVLIKCLEHKTITKEDKEKAKYLWNTGFVTDETLFSPLFTHFVTKHAEDGRDNNSIELSKKEHMLFELLKLKPNEITEREDIVEKVWPEYQEFGVSDWSIDRLVARLRGKLKQQKAPFEIQTIRTRGYKLLTK